MPWTWIRNKDRLTGSAQRVEAAVVSTFRAQAPAIGDRVNQRTPVDTGNLKSRNQVTANGMVIEGENLETYAAPVHEGTHKMMGRPFMRQGFEESIPPLEQQLTEVVTRELS